MSDHPTPDDDLPSPLSPFDWTNAGHAIVRAGEAVDWKFSDPTSFIKRVQSIEFGLSAEIEFAAILSWLGRCSIVHRLDQEYFTSHSQRNWVVPDLLAIFDHDGIQVPALIEVKTRSRERLKIRMSDLESMQAYAKALSLPLLVAWKPRRLGFWILVDPIHAEKQDTKSILTFEASIKNNLMSTVAGDFMIVPKKNAGLFFEARIVKKSKETKSGFEGIAQITNAEFRDATGKSAKNIPASIIALMFASMAVVDEHSGNEIRRSFVTKDEPIHAQQILRTVVAMRAGGQEPLKWRHVAKDLDQYLSRDSLHNDIHSHFGTFVQFGLFQHPQNWPHFLPEAWNAVTNVL